MIGKDVYLMQFVNTVVMEKHYLSKDGYKISQFHTSFEYKDVDDLMKSATFTYYVKENGEEKEYIKLDRFKKLRESYPWNSDTETALHDMCINIETIKEKFGYSMIPENVKEEFYMLTETKYKYFYEQEIKRVNDLRSMKKLYDEIQEKLNTGD